MNDKTQSTPTPASTPVAPPLSIEKVTEHQEAEINPAAACSSTAGK